MKMIFDCLLETRKYSPFKSDYFLERKKSSFVRRTILLKKNQISS